MPEWSSVCCAVDFSEPSRLAMEQAVELVRRFGGALTLVHVQELPRAAATDLLAEPVGMADDLAEELARLMEGWRSDAERILGRERVRGDLGRERDVFARRYAGEEIELLKHEADRPRAQAGQFVFAQAREKARQATCKPARSYTGTNHGEAMDTHELSIRRTPCWRIASTVAWRRLPPTSGLFQAGVTTRPERTPRLSEIT